jgi:hypothetical protein
MHEIFTHPALKPLKRQSMFHNDLDSFLKHDAAVLGRGPIALIFAEDAVELATTLRHHRHSGFPTMLLFGAADLPVPADLTDKVHHIAHDMRDEDALPRAINAVIPQAAGQWIFYCYNAEYLFFPFCENRTVPEMLAFHTEERRDAMLSYVVDLYAGDLRRCPNAVSLDDAWIDRSGYYALARADSENHNHPKERQLDFFGGLRWRYEEHVPVDRRKIDRISLFLAKRGLTMRDDHTLSDEEYNTYACPWHNNITSAIASFRTAKALKTNPGSTFDIQTFRWHNSTPFEWHSRQLLDLGLMEPGQWF